MIASVNKCLQCEWAYVTLATLTFIHTQYWPKILKFPVLIFYTHLCVLVAWFARFFLQTSNNATTFPLSSIQYVVMYPRIQDRIQSDCRHILVGRWKHLNAPVSLQFSNTSVSGPWKLLQGQSHVIISDAEITPKLTVVLLVSLTWWEDASPVIWTRTILLSCCSTYLIPDQSDLFEWESNVKECTKMVNLFLSLQVHTSCSC